MNDSNLITTCSFYGQEYLFKMNALNSILEILITEKNSGEEWQCSYDSSYIESLTRKTGNFKHFDIFVAMIKSGLLRTSESVSLDLLTYEDLELLRKRRISKHLGKASNRRYLIVTYIVEFDKIRYPLPLEYCGPPDPVILQSAIKRLELELTKTKEELALKRSNQDSKKVFMLQKRIDELTDENSLLKEEIKMLKKTPERKQKTQMLSLQKAIVNLEQSVINERNSHQELVEKLRSDKAALVKELERVKKSEKQLKMALYKNSSKLGLGDHVKTNTKAFPSSEDKKSPLGEMKRGRPRSKFSCSSPRYVDWCGSDLREEKNIKSGRSRSSSASSRYLDMDNASLRSQSPRLRSPVKSRSSSVGSKRSCSSASYRSKVNKEKLDLKVLEERISSLQKLLKDNLLNG